MRIILTTNRCLLDMLKKSYSWATFHGFYKCKFGLKHYAKNNPKKSLEFFSNLSTFLYSLVINLSFGYIFGPIYYKFACKMRSDVKNG